VSKSFAGFDLLCAVEDSDGDALGTGGGGGGENSVVGTKYESGGVDTDDLSRVAVDAAPYTW